MVRSELVPLGLQINVFPLILPAGSALSYRIWTVDPVPRTPEMREKIRGDLRWRLLHRAVAGAYDGDRFVYAVVEGGAQDAVEFVGDGAVRYVIAPTGDRRSILLDQLGTSRDNVEIELAVDLLQQEYIRHLNRSTNLASDRHGATFFDTTSDTPYRPTNARTGGALRRDGTGAADIFRGFSFRIVCVAGVGLCIVLDVRTTYIGRSSLADYLKHGQMPEHVDRDWGGSRWVNDYGTVKQSAYLVSVLDAPIGDVRLSDDRSTYMYLCETRPQIRDQISPDDRAAMIMYRADDLRREERHYPAATTLLRPKFTTKSPEVRALNDTAAFPPAERWRRIDHARGYLHGFRFGGGGVRLGPALHRSFDVLPLPDLLFGPADAPTTLSAGERSTGDTQARQRWGERKTQALRRHGPYLTKPFTNPVFVYPQSLEPDDLVETVLAQTQAYCLEYGKVPFDPDLNSYRDAAHPREIIDKLKGIESARRAGFILLALPGNPGQADQVYAGIKTQVRLPSKCFSTANLRGRTRDAQRLASYLQRNALGMLIEAETRPWGLASPLTYEMHFGFDVARYKSGRVSGALMGAAVITEGTGTDIRFANKEIDARERIPAKSIGAFILEELERFSNLNHRVPRSVLFQRDGRLFDAELRGIRSALRKYAETHPEMSTSTWAAITVEKSTAAPLRLFQEEAQGRSGRALSGSYFVQDPSVGYLILAGAPSLTQGTPRPIRVAIIGSSATDLPPLIPILSDLFRLSQLNWNAPEIDISLPITLRGIDQKLERYTLEADDAAADDDEDWDDYGE